MDIIFIIGIVQAFFFEFLLLNKKKKNLSDKILSVWLFVMGLHLFLFYLFHIEYYHTFPFFMGFMQPFPLLHGPFLLLYVYSLTRPESILKKTDFLHFLPALAFYIFIFPDAFLRTGPELMDFAFNILQTNPPVYWMIFETMINVSGVVYVLWSLFVLMKHRRTIKDNFSYTEKINLGWLMKLILGLAAIWVVVLATDKSEYIFVTETIFIFLIGYFGSRQGVIFTDRQTQKTDEIAEGEPKSKYEKSSLTQEKSDQILQTLEQYMADSKPYLEPKIALKDISEKLEIHPNHLSQVINETLNVNFYDFVNSYRVEEFKNRVANDPTKKFTLLAHAYDSGYSSKSSFNEVFKKFTGLTPSEYQKQLQ